MTAADEGLAVHGRTERSGARLDPVAFGIALAPPLETVDGSVVDAARRRRRAFAGRSGAAP